MALMFILMVFSNVTFSDSLYVTLKPAKGLSGTTSLNIHDDKKVTVLVYESSVKISENTVEIEPQKVEELRILILAVLNDYLNLESFNDIKEYPFTIALAYTNHGVTKNISSKRINKKGLDLIKQIVIINPDIDLNYVTENIQL